MPINDNHPTPFEDTPAVPDPSGLAALLLVESLIHGLCENHTLSNDQAIEIIERAAEVQLERAEDANGTDGADTPMLRSHAMLAAILASLRTEGNGPPPGPRLV